MGCDRGEGRVGARYHTLPGWVSLCRVLRGESPMFRVAHLSDLHATPARAGLPALAGKRFFGWLSWQLRRRHAHQSGVLDALLADLHREAPDQIVVTGDLTNVAGEEEFPAARTWLERIGPPERVSIVPGNHDAYVRVAPERGVGLWRDYIASDAGDADPAPSDEFPTLRVRGALAVVGLSSAVPTPLFQARGRIGAGQLGRLGGRGARSGRERARARALRLPLAVTRDDGRAGSLARVSLSSASRRRRRLP